jgi:hypothetical protein
LILALLSFRTILISEGEVPFLIVVTIPILFINQRYYKICVIERGWRIERWWRGKKSADDEWNADDADLAD